MLNRIAITILVIVLIFPASVVSAQGGKIVSEKGASWNPLHYSIASVFLDRGFAVAESGYSKQGWALEEAVVETEAVRNRFTDLHGKPDSTFVAGHSMGGIITLATIETYSDSYNGALPMCGPLAPAVHFFGDHIFDMLVTFEALFGEGLPEGSEPVIGSPALKAQDIEAALNARPDMADVYAAILQGIATRSILISSHR